MSSHIKNEAVTCKLDVKPIVTMAKGDKTFFRILTLTINEKQCNTVQCTIDIDQTAVSIRVELMIIHITLLLAHVIMCISSSQFR